MSATPRQRRRRPTRWTLVAGVAVLALVLTGTELLLRAKPVNETAPFIIEDLPAIGLDPEPIRCRRDIDEDALARLRGPLTPDTRITSAHVVACPVAYDGLRVTFVGEAVGDLIDRDGGVWVQVNDDDYALEVGPMGAHREHRGFNSGLAVWLPDGLHEQIEAVGGPGRRGDVVLVQGVLRRADPGDGGGITLRADHLEVVAPTVAVPEPLHGLQAAIAALLAVTAAGVLVWSRRVRYR